VQLGPTSKVVCALCFATEQLKSASLYTSTMTQQYETQLKEKDAHAAELQSQMTVCAGENLSPATTANIIFLHLNMAG
jgi:hypothetical protein